MPGVGGIRDFLNFDFVGHDRTARAFASLNRGLSVATRGAARLATSFAGMTAAAAAVGTASTAMLALTLGIGGALKVTHDFQDQMNRVEAVSGATAAQFEQLRSKALDLGNSTQFSAGQVADAMGFMSMAGLDTQQVFGGVGSTLKLAGAANLDMGRAADIVTNILTAYRMEVADLGHAVDVLAKSFTSANTDLEQLGDAFKFAGGVAKSSGLEFEETAAALALLGNAGFQGEMAGTALRGAITKLLNPSKEAAAAMKSIGFSAVDSNGRLKSLTQIIRELQPHVNNTALFLKVFAQRAGPGMLALVSQGADAIEDFTAKLRDSEGVADRLNASRMKGLPGAWREAKSAAEGFGIALGDSGLGGAFERLLRGTAEFLRANTKVIRAFSDSTVAAMENKLAILNSVASLDRLFGSYTKYIPLIGSITSMARDEIAKVTQQIETAKWNATVNVKPEIDKKAAEKVFEELATTKTDEKAAKKFKKIIQGIGDETNAIRLQSKARGMGVAAAERMFAVEKALNSARDAGITLTGMQRAEILASADAFGQAAAQADQLETSLQKASDMGAAAGNALQNAFDQWLDGTEVKAKDVFASMLKEMARLQFQAQVLAPLFGASYGGQGGGVVGNALSSIFGGFRAAGGPVTAGKAYVVGERGPEIFSPGMSGEIIPSGRMSSGTPSNMHVTVGISVDDQGKLQAFVKGVAQQESGRVVASAAPSIIDQSTRSAGAAIAKGKYDNSMRYRYGSKARANVG